jgi:hypothetical protein
MAFNIHGKAMPTTAAQKRFIATAHPIPTTIESAWLLIFNSCKRALGSEPSNLKHYGQVEISLTFTMRKREHLR